MNYNWLKDNRTESGIDKVVQDKDISFNWYLFTDEKWGLL